MKYRALLAAFIAICFTFLTACSGEETISDAKVLTYDDIVNTGLANSCPQLKETVRGSIPLDPSQYYVLTDLSISSKNNPRISGLKQSLFRVRYSLAIPLA